MLFYIFVGVLFIALIVFLVLSAKNWHWAHITAVVLVFLAAVPAYYCLAYSLKTRKALVKQYHDSVKELNAERTKYFGTLYGAQPGTRGGFGDGSLKAELARYNLLTTGKGRSWDQATIQARNGNELTIDIPVAAAPNPENPAADPAAPADPTNPAPPAPAAPAPAPEGGEYPLVGSLLYVFQLTGLTIEENRQVPVPGGYVGAYRVTAVNGTVITAIAETAMEIEVNNGDPVALFERPPQDTNDVMNMALRFESGDKPSIDDYRQRFAAVFPADSFKLEEDSKAYQDMLDSFSFDGRSINEINEWRNAQGLPEWNPGVEEIQVVSRVLRQMEETVDGTQDMLISGVFDSLGRANDPELQLGKSAQIAVSREGDEKDVLVVDAATATSGYTRQDGTQVRSWEEEGRIQPVNRLYSRRLRDYTTEIEQLMFDQGIFSERITEYTRLNTSVSTSVQAADAQEQLRQTKITELTQDQDHLKADIQVANGYLSELETRLADLRREIRDNYLQISNMHQQSSQEAQAWAAAQR